MVNGHHAGYERGIKDTSMRALRRSAVERTI